MKSIHSDDRRSPAGSGACAADRVTIGWTVGSAVDIRIQYSMKLQSSHSHSQLLVVAKSFKNLESVITIQLVRARGMC